MRRRSDLKKKQKPADTAYEDYFKSAAHKHAFETSFQRTFKKLVSIATSDDMAVQDVVDGRDNSTGLLYAVSEAQGIAAGIAHFYGSSGLKQQGAEYLRGLAKNVEEFKPEIDEDK